MSCVVGLLIGDDFDIDVVWFVTTLWCSELIVANSHCSMPLVAQCPREPERCIAVEVLGTACRLPFAAATCFFPYSSVCFCHSCNAASWDIYVLLTSCGEHGTYL